MAGACQAMSERQETRATQTLCRSVDWDKKQTACQFKSAADDSVYDFIFVLVTAKLLITLTTAPPPPVRTGQCIDVLPCRVGYTSSGH